MSLISDANDIAFFSTYDVDKIVGVWEGSFNRATDVITRTGDFGNIYLYRIAHGFTRPVFVDYIWQIGGVWADSGSLDDLGDTSIAFSDSTYIYIVSSVFAPAAGTMNYKVIASWITDYDTTNPSVTPYQSPLKQVNFDSRDNYQKIYRQNVLSYAVAGTQSVIHGIGRKVNFRVFYEAITNEVWPAFAGGASNPFLYSSTMTECRATNTTTTLSVQLEVVASTKRAWYKIYLDS